MIGMSLTPAQPLRLRGRVAGRISFPPEADLKKQGQSGSSRFERDRDAAASGVTQYKYTRKPDKAADEPESPSPFSNEIRPVIINDKKQLVRFVYGLTSP